MKTFDDESSDLPIDLPIVELDAEDFRPSIEDIWFADRPLGSMPPPRTKSVPPMGDDDVDPWLR